MACRLTSAVSIYGLGWMATRRRLQVREYMTALEAHLAEAHRQAQRLLKRQADLGTAMAEFGAAMASLGTLEEGRLATAFTGLGDKAAAVASTGQVRPRCSRSPRAYRVLQAVGPMSGDAA